jgi:predicted GNAT superfamily acetyltransferase
MYLRPYTDADLAPMLALNNAHAVELGPLTMDSLRRLLGTAMRVRIAGTMDGFLIALDESASYDSPNFLWFKARFARFAYIDRVVIAENARGRGLARQLYEDLFAAASRHTHVFCEVNYDPPNPASEAFHRALGFKEIGRATLADRGKSVRYLSRAL